MVKSSCLERLKWLSTLLVRMLDSFEMIISLRTCTFTQDLGGCPAQALPEPREHHACVLLLTNHLQLCAYCTHLPLVHQNLKPKQRPWWSHQHTVH